MKIMTLHCEELAGLRRYETRSGSAKRSLAELGSGQS